MKVCYTEYQEELQRLRVELEKRTLLKDASRFVRFVNLGNDKDIRLGLNIAGSGRISAIVAKRVAYAIEVAAELAEGFKYNGYTIFGG